MSVPSRLVGTMLALVLCGCQATVTLKSPESGATPADAKPGGATTPSDSAPAAAPDIASIPVAAEEGAAPSPTPDLATRPATATPPAQAVPAIPVIATPSRMPVTSAASVPASGSPTFKDRFQSGLHTGTVGAAFGGLGGPIGLAAGGGAGFIAGFVAGRPIFGGAGRAGRQGSWDRQVQNQQTWEEQVAARVEGLDGPMPPPATGIGDVASPASANPKPPGEVRDGADPEGDYEAWTDQIMTHALPASARSAAGDSQSEPGDEESAGESEIAGESP